MKTILAVSAVLLVSCASAPTSAPVKILVDAQNPMKQSDADTLRKVTIDQISNDLRAPRQMTVRIEIGPGIRPSDAYATFLTTNDNRTVPYVSPVASAETILSPVVAKYEILDASGAMIESGYVPSLGGLDTRRDASGSVPVTTIEAYHDIARYVAARVRAHRL